MTKVAELWVYPVKGCQGIAVSEAKLDGGGLEWDRVFGVVDATTLKRHTQSSAPKLASISVDVSGEQLVLTAANGAAIYHPHPAVFPRGRGEVTAFKSDGPIAAFDEGDEIAGWLTDVLGVGPVRLMRTADLAMRFSYSASLLVISRASLDDLNRRLPKPVPMDRFRPNIVVDGCDAYEEDSWASGTFGDLELTRHKSCVRCVYTTMDQTSGERVGHEPLATLAKYRKTEEGVIFGSYFRHVGIGAVRIGDSAITTRSQSPS